MELADTNGPVAQFLDGLRLMRTCIVFSNYHYICGVVQLFAVLNRARMCADERCI